MENQKATNLSQSETGLLPPGFIFKENKHVALFLEETSLMVSPFLFQKRNYAESYLQLSALCTKASELVRSAVLISIIQAGVYLI